MVKVKVPPAVTVKVLMAVRAGVKVTVKRATGIAMSARFLLQYQRLVLSKSFSMVLLLLLLLQSHLCGWM